MKYSIVLVSFLCGSMFFGCKSKMVISGKIVNPSGNTPVQGALITTEPPTSSVLTNAQGEYSIEVTDPRTYTVIASQEGKSIGDVQVIVSEGSSVTAEIQVGIFVSQRGKDRSDSPQKAEATENIKPSHDQISQGQIPTQGLIAYYPFNGNERDESGNGYNGTAYATTLTMDRFGNARRAYSFDGVQSEISLGVLPPINDYTVSVWFCKGMANGYPNVPPHHGEADLFGTQMLATNNCLKFGFHSAWKDRILFQISDKGTLENADFAGGYTSVAIVDAAWHNFIMVRVGSSIRLVLDGRQVSWTPIGAHGDPSTTISTNAVTKLGALGGVSGMHFLGKLDDIRIYDRALSESEIQALYHEGGWK